MNKFVNRSERQKQVVTLLTGKLTFQEAQVLRRREEGRRSAAHQDRPRLDPVDA